MCVKIRILIIYELIMIVGIMVDAWDRVTAGFYVIKFIDGKFNSLTVINKVLLLLFSISVID